MFFVLQTAVRSETTSEGCARRARVAGKRRVAWANFFAARHQQQTRPSIVRIVVPGSVLRPRKRTVEEITRRDSTVEEDSVSQV